jgi:2-keto-3-deoxy-L-rhamnonate aldolase RhmA
MNPLKDLLENAQPCIGAWLNSGSSLMAEAMASCGFKWLAIDMEHSATSLSQVEAIFTSAERWGVSPIVRLGEADPLLACRLLDSGAHGLIISKVEDANAFEEFAKHCLYPPTGVRGVGLGRANLWGDHFEDYFQNFQPVLMPMVETKKGVAAANDLASLSMVDGLFLGPYDLSTDCGDAGNMLSDEFINAVTQVKQACSMNNKVAGIHQVKPDMAELKLKIEEAFSFIAFGTDLLAVRHTFQDIKKIQD